MLAVETKGMSFEDSQISLNQLMSLPKLRDLAPLWGKAALDVLTVERPRENGVSSNIIRHAWQRIYLYRVDDPQFQQECLLKIVDQQHTEELQKDLREVIEFESLVHASEIPKPLSNFTRVSKSGKTRKSRKDERTKHFNRRKLSSDTMLQVATNAIVTADKQRELDAATPAVAKKKASKCGNPWCRQTGHTKQNCTIPNPAVGNRIDKLSADSDSDVSAKDEESAMAGVAMEIEEGDTNTNAEKRVEFAVETVARRSKRESKRSRREEVFDGTAYLYT
jgi:hypothetical protein